jgi:predicted ArsR family transcriptional regulator
MSTKTRETILHALRSRGKCTVKELADASGVSPVSVRHHLTHVQADGLVQATEERHGVGRPRFVYSLTEAGLEQSPTRYLQLTNRLIDEMKENLPHDKVAELFSGVADSMAADTASQFEGLPWDRRLDRLAQVLSQEGFSAEVERRPDSVLIRELSCPYLSIGRQHREVCGIDQGFIARALAVPVERVACVLDGDAHCTFTVSLGPSSMEVSP